MNSVNYKFDINNTSCNVFIENVPKQLRTEFNTLFTQSAIRFICDLVKEFDDQVKQLYLRRNKRKYDLKEFQNAIKFKKSQDVDLNWKIAPLPKRLTNRKLDLGDVSPTNLEHFTNALNSEVQGIQVDFDDAHCPTWKNQILGLYNVYKAVHNLLPNTPKIKNMPILMLRPRAWNMIEYHVIVDGKAIPGPLLDFGILMFHNAHIMMKNECGPYFYLSKIESSYEAELWNSIFTWTQNQMNIPFRTIKVCVLIENILSSFEMDNILYALKDHAIGLNCGIWDYAASIICKFGNDSNYLLPDRNKYVNMERHFLKRYLQLLIRTCHVRGALATGGMAAALVPEFQSERHIIIKKVLDSKSIEIQEGIDGFMVYDIKLVPYINKLWKFHCENNPNQISRVLENICIKENDLLQMPKGGVTLKGLKNNIEIAILFIYNWFCGNGHFYYQNSVEDSATAEISRSQIWQWIRQKAVIEDNNETVTIETVKKLTTNFIQKEIKKYSKEHVQKILHATSVFLEIVTLYDFPDFITSYLNDSHIFRMYHDHCNNETTKNKL